MKDQAQTRDNVAVCLTRREGKAGCERRVGTRPTNTVRFCRPRVLTRREIKGLSKAGSGDRPTTHRFRVVSAVWTALA